MNSRRRWPLLAMAMLSTMCQGISYTPSNFKSAVMPLLSGYGDAPVTDANWALAFSMGFVLLPAGMLLGGRLSDRGRVGTAMLLGALLTGGGLALAGFSTSILWYTAGFGALLSLGCGFSYGTCVGAAVRWFPDRRGLAAGLTVAALGVGGMLIVPLQRFLLNRLENPMDMFLILAGLLFVVIAAAAAVVRNPPPGYRPDGWTPPAAPLSGGGAAGASPEGLSWMEMVRTKRFWLLFAVYFAGTFPGMLVIFDVSGLVGYIAVPSIPLPDPSPPEAMALAAAPPPAAPAESVAWLGPLSVSLWGLANAAGRIGWGWVSDRLGRHRALRLMYISGGLAVTALAALAMLRLSWEVSPLTAGTLAVALVAAMALCFGGVLGTFPALAADAFGSRNAAANYAVLFCAFALAALLAPQAAALFRHPGGGLLYFLFAGPAVVVAMLGLALAAKIFPARKTD